MSFFMRSFAKTAALGVGAITTALVGVEASTETGCLGSLKKACKAFLPTADFFGLSKHNNCLANRLTPTVYTKIGVLVSLSRGPSIKYVRFKGWVGEYHQKRIFEKKRIVNILIIKE